MKSLRHEWYSNMDIIREMIPFLWRRDCSFINTETQRAVRFFSVKNPYYLIDIQNRIVKFHQDAKFNTYRSVACYKEIPDFTYNPSLRSNATKLWASTKEFNDGEYFDSYDLFFDFDIDDGNNKEQYIWLRDEILEFKEYLDDWIVPYQIYFSGKKGMQIVIPYESITNHNLSFSVYDRNNFFDFCKKLVEKIKNDFGLQFLDLNQNGVRTRLMKCPYSLSQIDCVVLPLTDQQVKDFQNPEQFHISKVFKKTKIRKRGSLERFQDLSMNNKKRNIKNFIKQFGGSK